jgi:hypothetical protein
MLGGLDHDERQMLHDLVAHFVNALNAERARVADLARKLDAANARLELFTGASYGAF